MRLDAPLLLPALVVTPSSATGVWLRESATWFPSARVHVVDGLTDPLPGRKAQIVVCPWDLLAPRRAELAATVFSTIVGDEAHFSKNPEAQRSAAFTTLVQKARHALLLSGTPIVNTAAEYRILRGIVGGDPPMLRRLLEDVAPDIPRKTRVRLNVGIPDRVRAEYDRISAGFEEWLDGYLRRTFGDEADAMGARAMSAESLAKMGYLRRTLGRGKVPAAAAWIARTVRAGEPIVAFAEHQEVLDLLGRAIHRARIPFVRLDGSSSRGERQAAIDAFQRGDVPVFLGSQAAKEGITLHRAAHALFVERWWTPAAEEQGEDRIRRIGQTRETTIWYAHAPDTVDDRIAEIVDVKREIIRDHIGSARVAERESLDLMGEWLRAQPDYDEVVAVAADSGRFPDLPPLPPARRIHAVLFSRERWDVPTMLRWLTTHRLPAGHIETLETHFRITLRRAHEFAPGTFEVLRLSSDFGVIVAHPTPRRIRCPRPRRLRSRSAR